MEESPKVQRIALAITRWIGSPTSIMLHTVVFFCCIIIALFRKPGLCADIRSGLQS